MTRRALDLLGGAICLLLAIVLLVVGLKASSLGDFAHDNVRQNLEEQKIFFPKEADLAQDERSPDVVKNAGKQVLTGEQAAAYANDFIAVHLSHIADGKTYSEVSAAAQADPTDTKLAGQAQTLFRGETLRGLLLEAYAFGKMGNEANGIAPWLFGGAALLALLGLGGLVHGLTHADRHDAGAVYGRRGATSAI
jgi:hypothetical protein